MNAIAELFEKVGTPLGMLVVVIHFASRLAKFFAPLIERLFASHIGMFDAMKAASEKTTPLIGETHDMVSDIHNVVVEPTRKPDA
jgi:hypothetical protein